MGKSASEIRSEWFISNVKKLERSGITQVNIAVAMGVKPQYLTPLLKGRRAVSEKFVEKFCERFEININDLYSKIGTKVGLMTDVEVDQHDKEVEEGKRHVATAPPNKPPGDEVNHEKIKLLERYITALEKQLADKDTIIETKDALIQILSQKQYRSDPKAPSTKRNPLPVIINGVALTKGDAG